MYQFVAHAAKIVVAHLEASLFHGASSSRQEETSIAVISLSQLQLIATLAYLPEEHFDQRGLLCEKHIFF